MVRKLSTTAITALVLICATAVFVPSVYAQSPDLTESAVTVSGTPVSGGSLQVTETVTNQGTGAAGSFNTNLYLSTNGTIKNMFVGFRTVTSLGIGLTSTATTTIKLPANAAGKYYVLACANGNSAVVESSYTNNCSASASFTIAGPDLIETGVSTTGTPVSGGTIQVVETTKNQGVAAADPSYTNFFLSANGTTKSTFLGSRYPASLAAGASSGPVTTSVKLPTNISGTYYVIACANANGAVAESDTTNNCAASSAFAVAGANLTESVTVAQSGILSSGALKITDTVTNSGGGPADVSSTNFWLSTNGTAKSVYLGYRSVAGLAAGANSGAVTTTVTVPPTVSGNYLVMACANGNSAIVESSYADNCSVAGPISVLSATATVVVDPTGLDGASCGTSVSPCKTITGGLAVASGKTTILLNPGVYTEQVSIAQSLTITAATKYAAVIQAPATALVPDSDGITSLVRIGSDVMVTVRGLTVQGPGPSGCGSITNGIFVANANAIISDNKVLSIRDSSYSGCQNGVAIRFGNHSLRRGAYTGTISNNVITDFQKAGIIVDGVNNTVDVTGNTVTGQNTPGINGQNGIEILRNAKGTVSNNTVSNAAYFLACPTDTADPNFGLCNVSGTAVGPKNSSAAGILLYDVNGGVTVSNNNVTGSDIGIWVAGEGPGTTNGSTNVLVKGNTVSNNRGAGIFIDTSSSSIQIYSNNTHFNGKDAQGNIVGFVDAGFAQGYGYDLVDENTNEYLNDWGYSGLPGAAPNSFDTNWGNGKGLLLNY